MGAIQLVYQATWRENLMIHERTLFGEMLLAPWECRWVSALRLMRPQSLYRTDVRVSRSADSNVSNDY